MFLFLVASLLSSTQAATDETTAMATNRQLCSLLEPFQLVSIQSNGKLRVTDQAKTLFDQCFNNEFHVVSVSGSFHTGKSFMLNALMNSTNGHGFTVGRTTESETRGIWISGAPIKREGSDHSFVFIDTEGLAAAENTEKHDAKIYSIGTLLSSHQLYNTIRNIDTRSIEALELLARRARLFQLKSGITELENNKQQSSFLNSKEGELLDFPSLTWVVQNFFQKQLPGETPTKWLHRLLVSVASSKQIVSGSITAGPSSTSGGVTLLLDHPSTSESQNDRNNRNERSTSTLRNIFAPMNAVTMQIPSYDPLDLEDLSKANLKQLLPDYIRDLNVLWHTIETSLNRPNVRKQSGSTLHSFLKVLVTSSNNDNLDSLPSLWYKYIETQKEAALKAVSNLFESRAMKYDLTVPLPMNTFTSEMNALAKTAQKNVAQLLFGLSSPTIESSKTIIAEHVDSLKAKLVIKNLNHIKQFATEKYQFYSKKGIEKMKKNCRVPTASVNIKRQAQVIAKEMSTLFNEDSSRYSKKHTQPYFEQLTSTMASELNQILELNRIEMEKIIKEGQASGNAQFKQMFDAADFPGANCCLKKMYNKLKTSAINAATVAFDSTTELCKTEDYYKTQRKNAINAFTNTLDSTYLEMNDKCIQKFVQTFQVGAKDFFDQKSTALEESFPIFDKTRIASVHQDNKQATLERFESSAGRFKHRAQYKQAVLFLEAATKQGLKTLQATNTRRIKKSVDPVLRDIQELLERNPALTKCELGPFDMGTTCVKWFQKFVEKETRHRLAKEWAGDKTKLQHCNRVVNMFFQTDLKKWLKKHIQKDIENSKTRNFYAAVGFVLLGGLFSYIYLNNNSNAQD